MRSLVGMVGLAMGCASGAGWATADGQAVRLEAENAMLSGPNLKVVTGEATAGSALTFSGTGYITGFREQADRAVFRYKAKASGLYKLFVSYRGEGRRGYDVEVNGTHYTGTFEKRETAGFAAQTVGTVEIAEGQNEIAIDRGWGFFDVDYIELAPFGPVVPPAAVTAAPVDAQATPEAAALLKKLDGLYGKTTLLGVYKDRDAAYVQTTAGVLPSIMGGDLIEYSPQRAAHGAKSDEAERLIARAKDGYTITLSWHWGCPSGEMDTAKEPWWKGFYTEATTFDVAKALADPASADYGKMMSDIDVIAVQLKKLQDANVPVLWRPLHEASGGWFWWGAKGPKPFVQLWQILYDRLTKVDGIHNLIWVYTGDSNMAWYPGDEYVDVIGIDQYPKDLHDPASALWDGLQERFAGKKLLTISEFGGVPDIPRMQRLGEFWSYAVSWSDREGPKKNPADEVKRIYTSAGVATMPAVASPVEPTVTAPVVAPAPGQN